MFYNKLHFKSYGINHMKVIGRKTYISWGDKIVAVEILAENKDEFKSRTNIDVDDGKTVISEIYESLGERFEKPVGNILIEPNYTDIENLGKFISHVKMISENDIIELAKKSNTPTHLQLNVEFDKQSEWINKYNQDDNFISNGFVGFIQLSDDNILKQYCSFESIAFRGSDNKSYVPTYIFERNEPFFDHNEDDSKEKPIVVFFHGTDNGSYGERFKTMQEAQDFVSNGFLCGFKRKLRFYNS